MSLDTYNFMTYLQHTGKFSMKVKCHYIEAYFTSLHPTKSFYFQTYVLINIKSFKILLVLHKGHGISLILVLVPNKKWLKLWLVMW